MNYFVKGEILGLFTPSLVVYRYRGDILYKQDIIRSHFDITLPLVRRTWFEIFTTFGTFSLLCCSLWLYLDVWFMEVMH
jgi:hypothetical protein